MKIGNCEVNVFPAPAFMGCEEIVFPICLRRWPATSDEAMFPLKADFQLAELGKTLAGGLNAAFDWSHPIATESVVFHDAHWDGHYPESGNAQHSEAIKQMRETLKGFGTAYGFFWEQSSHPLAHGYINRCRFVSPQVIQKYYGTYPYPLNQQHSAEAVAEAFILSDGWAEGQVQSSSVEALEEIIYGRAGFIGYSCGDCENHFIDFGFWKEAEGVCRLWSRINHCPK